MRFLSIQLVFYVSIYYKLKKIDLWVSRQVKEQEKIVPRVRIELTTFRLLCRCDYETDALPTALSRHVFVCIYEMLNLCIRLYYDILVLARSALQIHSIVFNSYLLENMTIIYQYLNYNQPDTYIDACSQHTSQPIGLVELPKL